VSDGPAEGPEGPEGPVQQVARVIDAATMLTCYAGVVAMTVLVLAQVVLRYGFSIPLPWVEEATILMMIWLTFAGTAAALRRGAHVAATMLVDRLSPRLQWLFAKLALAAVLAFCLVLAWQGWALMQSVGGQRTAALALPMWVAYAIIPLGSLLTAIQAFAAMLRDDHLSAGISTE
jgi:TRAP-type C4-dicarboxylate transport system permease small subunit